MVIHESVQRAEMRMMCDVKLKDETSCVELRHEL